MSTGQQAKQVDPVKYQFHINRVRQFGSILLTDINSMIDQKAATNLMKVTLYSLNHQNPDAGSKRIVENLVDGSNPGKIEFKNLDDFIEKMSKKIMATNTFDETTPDQ